MIEYNYIDIDPEAIIANMTEEERARYFDK